MGSSFPSCDSSTGIFRFVSAEFVFRFVWAIIRLYRIMSTTNTGYFKQSNT